MLLSHLPLSTMPQQQEQHQQELVVICQGQAILARILLLRLVLLLLHLPELLLP
jgi:hypothetical protein